MPFERDVALHSIPLSNQPFKMQPQIENEDVIWSLQCDLPVTRSVKRRTLSLQEVELDGRFLILCVVLKACTSSFMHGFNMSFVFHFLCSWINILDLNRRFNWRADIWEPFKMKFIWGLQSWTLGVPYKVYAHVPMTKYNTRTWIYFIGAPPKLKPSKHGTHSLCELRVTCWRSNNVMNDGPIAMVIVCLIKCMPCPHDRVQHKNVSIFHWCHHIN